MKSLIFFGIFLILISLVNAEDLSNYPDIFIEDNKLNGLIIVGDRATAGDTIGATEIKNKLEEQSIEVQQIILASMHNDLNSDNLILVGMSSKDTVSCNNLIDKFYFDKPMGPLIKLIKDGERYILIVTGDSANSVKEAAQILSDYENYDLDGSQFGEDIGREPEKVKEIGLESYDIEDKITKWTTEKYEIDGKEYEITLFHYNPFHDPQYVRFTINDESTWGVSVGEVYELSNGDKITLIDMADDWAEFQFKAEEIPKCHDSDDGENYNNYGEVTFKEGNEETVLKDYCNRDKAYDYYCNADGTYSVDWKECEHECKEGVCIDTPKKDHLLVVDKEGQASDVIILTDIRLHMGEYGFTNFLSPKLNDEVSKDMLDYRVTTFIHDNHVLIIVGENSIDDNQRIADRISWFVLNEKGIKSVIKSSSDITDDDLKNALDGWVPKKTKVNVEHSDSNIENPDKNDGLNNNEEKKEECSNDLHCDDDNACTIDSCVIQSGVCSNTEIYDRCSLNDACLTVGSEINGSYCDKNETMLKQRTINEECAYDYMCITHNCIDNKCLDKGIVEKIKEFISKLFYDIW
ncbi:MAG: hypothetical protein ABIJ08_05065 [Nanoarchaeota archaeon]